MYHIGFILEQVLGHVTFSQNLQQNVSKDLSVIPHWGMPAWETNDWTNKIPLIQKNWTLRAGLQTRRSLAAMNRQAHLDALFFHTQVMAILAQDWLRKIPSILSLDATPQQYDSMREFYGHAERPEWLERQRWRVNRDCYRRAHHLVPWSQWTARSLIDRYEVPAEKITVIPGGVNSLSWARPTPRRFHSGPVKILFVGANLERKGGLLLLEAFRLLKQRLLAGISAKGLGQAIELHLVTKNVLPSEPGLFVYNNMQPNNTELKQLYHNCDIFCLPTQGDCLPYVLCEAGSAGLPAISTQVGAIPEIVWDGESGFIIPPGDIERLVEALQRLIFNEELRLRMGDRAIEIIRQHFDAEQNTQRLLDLIKQTIEESRTRAKMRE
jgi:glycosyltransferase involved in cell wall biosynthesis